LMISLNNKNDHKILDETIAAIKRRLENND